MRSDPQNQSNQQANIGTLKAFSANQLNVTSTLPLTTTTRDLATKTGKNNYF
jgi:hypothetical protein